MNSYFWIYWQFRSSRRIIIIRRLLIYEFPGAIPTASCHFWFLISVLAASVLVLPASMPATDLLPYFLSIIYDLPYVNRQYIFVVLIRAIPADTVKCIICHSHSTANYFTYTTRKPTVVQCRLFESRTVLCATKTYIIRGATMMRGNAMEPSVSCRPRDSNSIDIPGNLWLLPTDCR